MGSPADCAFDFRQSHLNMIKESRRLAPLAENTAEMLAWRSVANCHQRHNVCAATSSTKGPRRRDLQPGSAKLCDYKQAMSALLRLPSLTYGGQSQCSPE